MMAHVGVPEEIHTDQGSNFMSQLLAEVYQLKIQPISTTPYHPQTDSLAERFNQMLKAMLRRAMSTEGKDWDKLIPYLLFAYRGVPQASTGFAPFELLYGRQVRRPLDVRKESWEASRQSDGSVVSSVMSGQKIAAMVELVKDNLEKSQKEQKRSYDRNAWERQFQAGEQGLVLLPTSTNKLLTQWQGPYPVLRRVSPMT